MFIIVRQGDTYYIQKVTVIETRKFDSTVMLNDGTILIRREGHVIDTYELASIIRDEIQIAYDFKCRKYQEDGKFICSNCKASGDDVRNFSLDHIKALGSYKGDLRQDHIAWKWYWNDDNLQILCKRCNQAKGKLPAHVNTRIDKFARKKNMKKQKKAYSNRARNKVGFDVPTGKRNRNRVDIETAQQIAKRDSRVLNLDLILGKNCNSNKGNK